MDSQDVFNELLSIMSKMQNQINEFAKEIDSLKIENALLKQKLNQNSSNSHKPPSSAGYEKKPALIKAAGGKVGGQVGHKGTTLKITSNPDITVVHHAEKCSCCKRNFEMKDVSEITHKRQIFDIPEPKLIVTEHQLGEIVCCGHRHLGVFPEGVSAPAQYGLGIKTMAVLLNNEYRMPFEKISQFTKDVFGYSINESTISRANSTTSAALEPTEVMIKKAVTESEVVHFDETGMRVEGKLQWFHTASTKLLTYLFVHANRGKQALDDEKSILKDFTNTAVHDCWNSYFNYENCSHALCNAHILRELTSLIEGGSNWAKKMHSLLLEIYEAVKNDEIKIDNWVLRYNDICQLARLEEPPPETKQKGERGKYKNTKGMNLLNRLEKHASKVLAFAINKSIPFTNNLAERDIRHVKIKQKIAMSFRTFQGAEIYARIQSFIGTTRKQGQNTFKELQNILKGDVYQLAFVNT